MDDELKAFWFGAFLSLMIVMVFNCIGCLNKHENLRNEYVPNDMVAEYKCYYKNDEEKAEKIAYVEKVVAESNMVISSINMIEFNETVGDDSTARRYVIIKAAKHKSKKEDNQKDNNS